MPTKHTTLNIKNEDFDAVLRDFNNSLVKMKVEPELLYEIMLRIEKLRMQIVK